MDIDRIIKGVADSVLNDGIKENKDIYGSSDGVADGNIEECNINDLRRIIRDSDIKNEDIRTEIYYRFKNDVQNIISDYLTTSEDSNADKGMYKCSLETWQACTHEIGLNYFRRYKLLKADAVGGGVGVIYDDDLLHIALEVYESLCTTYKKQFFIYDCCRFLGMTKDVMYKLSAERADLLKNGHSAQEASMRTALASGRSNVTAMAILLNHDYDYTRTTQVIHTSGSKRLTADNLPKLEQTQDIVIGDQKKIIPDSTELL